MSISAEYARHLSAGTARECVGSVTNAKALQDPNLDFQRVAGILQMDPVVADGRSDLKDDAPLLETAIRALRGPVGMMLLKEWGFDTDLITTAGAARRWERRASEPDYCDIVQVAQLHAGLLGARKVEGPALNELPAFKRLGPDRMDAGEGMLILQEAKSQINATIKLLLR